MRGDQQLGALGSIYKIILTSDIEVEGTDEGPCRYYQQPQEAHYRLFAS